MPGRSSSDRLRAASRRACICGLLLLLQPPSRLFACSNWPPHTLSLPTRCMRQSSTCACRMQEGRSTKKETDVFAKADQHTSWIGTDTSQGMKLQGSPQSRGIYLAVQRTWRKSRIYRTAHLACAGGPPAHAEQRQALCGHERPSLLSSSERGDSLLALHPVLWRIQNGRSLVVCVLRLHMQM